MTALVSTFFVDFRDFFFGDFSRAVRDSFSRVVAAEVVGGEGPVVAAGRVVVVVVVAEVEAGGG